MCGARDRPSFRTCAPQQPTGAAQEGIIICAEQAMERHHERSRPVRLVHLRTGTPGAIPPLPGTYALPSTLKRSVPAAGESYALGYDMIGQAEKVLKQAAANSPKYNATKGALLFPALIESVANRRDEFFVVERLHEKGNWTDRHCSGTRGKILSRRNDNYTSLG